MSGHVESILDDEPDSDRLTLWLVLSVGIGMDPTRPIMAAAQRD